MKGIIEKEIEKYADKNGEYPKLVEVTENEYKTIRKELKREFQQIGKELEEPFKFRGCELKVNKKLSKFRVS